VEPPNTLLHDAHGAAPPSPRQGGRIARRPPPHSDETPTGGAGARGRPRPAPGPGQDGAAHDADVVLGRYRLREHLGSGGFGEVWRAHDALLDREVAVKRIRSGPGTEIARAKREAQACARLSHPSIVALYEAGADEHCYYLISEYVDGTTLTELIAGDALDDEAVAEIGLALAEALAHAHARGVVHRDVKPHNVLIPHAPAARAAAKLTDFGGASLLGEDGLTRTGDVLGTLAYMAPEQCEGHAVGPEADLYALALVLYEGFTGRNPVRGATPAATARRIGRRIEPLERHRRDLPLSLTRALDASLAPDPRDRGSLEELAGALEEGLDDGLRTRRAARARRRERRGQGAPATARALAQWQATHPHGRRAADGRHANGHANGQPGAHGDALHAPAGMPATYAGAGAEGPSRAPHPAPLAPDERLTLPRAVWLGCALALCGWQAVTGHAGVALLLAAALTPLIALPRRSGGSWLLAGLAPALGALGLAGAFPAVAGQRTRARTRAAIAALGFWWLSLAEPLVAHRLWLGPPAGVPARFTWEGSLTQSAVHVVGPMFSAEVLLGAALWAAAAAVLPWIVRGASAALDIVAATVWSAALVSAVPVVRAAATGHAAHASPRGAILGAVLGGVVAVAARALRGPV
jgi:eukaryotic-like serine/threonine-protein kinase